VTAIPVPVPAPPAPSADLLAALAPRDDPALWTLAAEAAFRQAGGLFDVLEPRPRHVVVTFAALPRRHPALHPDDAAEWKLSWSLEPGGDAWRPEGASPRLRRKRGHHCLTVCVPGATRRLAAVEVVCLWRPRFPWAPPEETEIGREVRLFLRDSDGAWRPRGVRAPHAPE